MAAVDRQGRSLERTSEKQWLFLPDAGVSRPRRRRRGRLHAWSLGFASRRADVHSPDLAIGKRGLHPDEAAGFLQALDQKLLHVDSAGFVTPLAARKKAVGGRYALVCKSGEGTGVNLEYLIQLAAAGELVTEHGWPPECVQVESGEFDLVGYRSSASDDVVMAVEAKARVRGNDSLEKLLTSLLALAADSEANVGTNARNKFRELMSMSDAHPVVLWLVAAGARWAFDASTDQGTLVLEPRTSVAFEAVVANLP